MRWFLWLGVLAACGSDPGGSDMDGGTVEEAVVRAIVPDVGHPDRTIDVTIAVDGIALDDTATLALGDGVTVDELDVTDGVLRARVTIAADATFGMRDVTIASSGQTLVAPAGFRVGPHLEATVTGARGQIVELAIDNLDTVGLYPPHLFEGGVWIVRQDEASVSHWRGLVIVDPLAPASAAIGMRNTSPTFEPLQHFVASPASIEAGVTIEHTVSSEVLELRNRVLANPGDTVVYALTTSSAGVLGVTVGPESGSPFRPHVAIVPPSGTFQDVIQDRPSSTVVIHAPIAGTYFVIVRDVNLGGGAAYTYGFLSTFDPHSTVSETAVAHATTATAQALPTGGIVDGTFAASDVQDVYRVPNTIITLQADADLELEILNLDGSSRFTMETSRPFDRTATYLPTGSATQVYAVVRSRNGNVGRPTGAYTLVVN